MRFLLDTAMFIWAISSPDRLSKRARETMADEEATRELSSLSLSEIAIKQANGKLTLGRSEVWTGISDLRLRVLSYTAAHSYSLFGLPLHHNDPFDRMLIAQAVSEDIPIVTSDTKFRLYKEVEVIW